MTDFGRDTSCTTSLRTGAFVSGVRLVAEACFRRLTTPRGSLRGGEEEQNYGMDLSEELGSPDAKERAASLPGRISNELTKDPRVISVTVTVTRTVVGAATRLDVEVSAKTALGPFTLKLRVSEVSVELLGIRES